MTQTRLTVYPHTGGSASEPVCQKQEGALGRLLRWWEGLHTATVEERNFIRKVLSSTSIFFT